MATKCTQWAPQTLPSFQHPVTIDTPRVESIRARTAVEKHQCQERSKCESPVELVAVHCGLLVYPGNWCSVALSCQPRRLLNSSEGTDSKGADGGTSAKVR
jgi:hypothetical protein